MHTNIRMRRLRNLCSLHLVCLLSVYSYRFVLCKPSRLSTARCCVKNKDDLLVVLKLVALNYRTACSCVNRYSILRPSSIHVALSSSRNITTSASRRSSVKRCRPSGVWSRSSHEAFVGSLRNRAMCGRTSSAVAYSGRRQNFVTFLRISAYLRRSSRSASVMSGMREAACR